MTGKTLLHPGDPFPGLIVGLPGGRTVHLPGDLAGRFGVVLFYRGAWCPYCNAQLRAFQRALVGLAGASVLGLSVDDEGTMRDLIARHGLRFLVGHSADAAAVADATGAFVNPDPPFLQSAGFVLDACGRVIVSVYSSGAIGRLVPQDVIGLVATCANTSGKPALMSGTETRRTGRRSGGPYPAREEEVPEMSERSRACRCSTCGADIPLDAALGQWTDRLGHPWPACRSASCSCLRPLSSPVPRPVHRSGPSGVTRTSTAVRHRRTELSRQEAPHGTATA